MSPSPKLSKLESYYGRDPLKLISKGKLLNEITDAMGNKYAFYKGIQDDILRLHGQPSDTTNEVYESLARRYATTYIKDWLSSIGMDDHPHLRMVEKVVDDFMKYNRANPRGDVFIPPHLTMPPIPPIDYEPEAPKKTVLRRILNTINNLKRTEDADTPDYNRAVIDAFGGKSKKSKKQQRKTKAKKTHRKRTQRK
jgi:hypothetical protein